MAVPCSWISSVSARANIRHFTGCGLKKTRRVERRELSGDGSFVFEIFDVGPLAMMWAIWFFRYYRVAAETEILFAGLTFRPAAHAGTKRLQADDLGRPGLLANGGSTLRKTQAVNLANNGVFGDAQPLPDDAGRKALIPKRDEDADPCRCPFF